MKQPNAACGSELRTHGAGRRACTARASRLKVFPISCLLGATTVTSTVRISGNFSYAVRSWPLFAECACAGQTALVAAGNNSTPMPFVCQDTTLKGLLRELIHRIFHIITGVQHHISALSFYTHAHASVAVKPKSCVQGARPQVARGAVGQPRAMDPAIAALHRVSAVLP